jgi:hypothetical protein
LTLSIWEAAWALLFALSWGGTQVAEGNRFLAVVMEIALPVAAIVPAALFHADLARLQE